MSGPQCEPHKGTVGFCSPADEDVSGGVNVDDNEEVNDGDNNGTEMVLYPLCIKHYTQCDKKLRIKHNFFAVYPILYLSSIDVCFDIFFIKNITITTTITLWFSMTAMASSVMAVVACLGSARCTRLPFSCAWILVMVVVILR